MPLLKFGEFVEDDWVALIDGESLPQGSDVIVPFERLVEDIDTLKAHNGSLGVAFPNDASIEDLKPYLANLDVVVLSFPAFGDGRAYSQAKKLKSQLGFSGEIRASGNVLPDQFAFMRQCGFNAFDVPDRQSLDAWQQSATSMTVAYQRGFGPERGFAPENALDRRKEYFDD